MFPKIQHNYFIITCGMLFCIGLFFLLPAHSQGQTKTWTGSTDSDWHNSNNWNPAGVPGTSDNVQIQPNGGNPYPVISDQDVTIASIVVSNHEAGELTVSNSRTLTITSELAFEEDGTLYIETGGSVNITGESFEMGYGNTSVDISNGSFTSETDVTVKGEGFNAGSNVELNFNSGLTTANDKSFSVDSGNINIDGDANIQGPFDIGAGSLNISGSISLANDQTFNAGQANIIIGGANYYQRHLQRR